MVALTLIITISMTITTIYIYIYWLPVKSQWHGPFRGGAPHGAYDPPAAGLRCRRHDQDQGALRGRHAEATAGRAPRAAPRAVVYIV